MSMEIIISEVLKLTPLQRIQLIQLIAESIASEEKSKQSQNSISSEQETELERRIQLYKEGKMQTTSALEVNEKMIKKYGLHT